MKVNSEELKDKNVRRGIVEIMHREDAFGFKALKLKTNVDDMLLQVVSNSGASPVEDFMRKLDDRIQCEVDTDTKLLLTEAVVILGLEHKLHKMKSEELKDNTALLALNEIAVTLAKKAIAQLEEERDELKAKLNPN